MFLKKSSYELLVTRNNDFTRFVLILLSDKFSFSFTIWRQSLYYLGKSNNVQLSCFEVVWALYRFSKILCCVALV